MSHNITVEGGKSVRLPTRGKYCDRDIVVTATGGSEDLDAVLAEQEALIATLQETLRGKATGSGGDGDMARSIVNRTIESYSDDKVTTIGQYAFNFCQQLESVYAPAVTVVETYAFRYCTMLQSVTLAATTIEAYAFYKSGLESLILLGDSVATLGNTNAFTNTQIESGTGYIYVHDSVIDSYRSATNWSAFADQFRAIEDYPDICGG